MTDQPRPVETPYAAELSACDKIIETIEKAEAAYRDGKSVDARMWMAVAGGLAVAHANG